MWATTLHAFTAATNSIRQNESRKASLDYVADHGGVIFDAVSTQPWSGDAIVHVSIVNWSKGLDVSPKVLWLNDGNLRFETDHISTSLAPSVDVRHAFTLEPNTDPASCFQGKTPGIMDSPSQPACVTTRFGRIAAAANDHIGSSLPMKRRPEP